MTIGTLVVVQAECCLEAHADKAPPLCLGCRPCFEHKGLLRRWGSGLLHGMELGWAEQGWPNTAMLRSEMAGGKVMTVLECVPERCLKLPTTGYIGTAEPAALSDCPGSWLDATLWHRPSSPVHGAVHWQPNAQLSGLCCTTLCRCCAQ